MNLSPRSGIRKSNRSRGSVKILITRGTWEGVIMKDGHHRPVGGYYALLRRLFEVAPPRYSLFWASIICILLASVANMIGLGLIIPVLNGLVTEDRYESVLNVPVLGKLIGCMPFEPTNKNVFVFMMMLLLINIYVENIFLYAGRMLSSIISNNLIAALQRKIFARYLTFGRAFYDGEKPGRLNSLVANVTAEVGRLIDHLAGGMIALTLGLAFFIFMIIVSWRLTLMASLLLPIVNFISTRLGEMARKSAKHGLDHQYNLSAYSLDNISNIPLVQISATEDQENARMAMKAEDIWRHQISLAKKQHFAPRIVEVVNLTGVVVVVCGSIFLYFSHSSYSIGSLLVYFVALRRFMSQLQQATDTWMRCIAFFPAVEKVIWVFEDEGKYIVPSGNKEFHRVAESITFENVSFGYATGQSVLRNLSFTVPRGKMLALVGPTGSGKTTLVNLLPRFYEYQTGAIRIDGTEIKEYDLRGLRRQIAVVSQHAFVLNDTIRTNLLYGLDPSQVSEDAIEDALRRARLYEFVAALPERDGTKIGDQGVRLSGGERQRLSIARAILSCPEILILDEATSALDTETELLVQKGLDELVGDRTIFVIAHRLSTVRNADYVLVLENGEIIEQGTPAELFASQGKFYHFSTLQNILY